MKIALSLSVLWALTGFVLAAPAEDESEAKGDKVEFDKHSGYFESNKSGLKGDTSFLVFNNQEKFDEVFGLAFVGGNRNKFLPKDAFEKKMVVATIKRGDSIFEYTVDKVTAQDGVLYVKYEAKALEKGGMAKFASPMILSLDKGKYKSVVFIENGKKIETKKLEK
jgi:hypothetical protein